MESEHTVRSTISAILGVAAALLLADLIAPRPALAYLDPGTGSMVFQWIVAGLLGGAAAFRMVFIRWRRRKSAAPARTDTSKDSKRGQ